jgi:tetratricopeptide (TPR) repeat protein
MISARCSPLHAVLLLTTALACVAASSRARAEDPASDRGTGTRAPAGSSEPVAGDEQAKDAAQGAYGAGITAFQQGSMEDAAAQFASADRLRPSPSAKLMLGRSLRQLGRRPEAQRTLEQAVAAAQSDGDSRYAQVAAAAQLELDELRSELGWLRLRIGGTRAGTAVEVAGRTLEPGELQAALAVESGPQLVRVRDGGEVVLEREVMAEAGREIELAIELPAGQADAPGTMVDVPQLTAEVTDGEATAAARSGLDLRNIGYGVGVFGVAGLIGFGVLGVSSAADFAELERRCPSRERCDARYERIASRGDTLQTAANLSLVVGLVGLATGVTLFVIGSREERSTIALTPSGIRAAGAF